MKEIKMYTYKEKEYMILKSGITMKDPHTRKWLPCVVYEQVESGMVFVREEEEFFKLFKYESR